MRADRSLLDALRAEIRPLRDSVRRRAGQTSAKLELVQLETWRKKIVESIIQGVRGRDVKDELIAIGNRKDELEAQLKTADEPPPLLHPSMADLYRSKVEELAAALQREDTRLEALRNAPWTDRSDRLDSPKTASCGSS
jgi:site-specific DNA recombinase